MVAYREFSGCGASDCARSLSLRAHLRLQPERRFAAAWRQPTLEGTITVRMRRITGGREWCQVGDPGAHAPSARSMQVTRSSPSKGFLSVQYAPARCACSRSASVVKAEMRMTGTTQSAWCIYFSNSMPLIPPGIWTSLTTQWLSSTALEQRNASADSNSATRYPRLRISPSSDDRIPASSSTIDTSGSCDTTNSFPAPSVRRDCNTA